MSTHRRRVATALAGVILLFIPLACGSSGKPSASTDSPHAVATELAAFANRGATSSWFVTFAFTRTTNGGSVLHDTVAAAHVAARVPIDIDSGLGSLVATVGSRRWSCTIVDDEPQCLQAAATGTNSPGAVYGGAVVSGRYAITRAPDSTIAGLAARCYFLKLRHGNPLSGIGFSSEQCYSDTGVPLRSRIQRSGSVDERVAQTVTGSVGRVQLLALLTPYGLQRLAPSS